jgi:DNA-binding PadR family transcriptional regulator
MHSGRALTPIALTTLEMLLERDMHPYEIHQIMVERRSDRMFRLSPGTLYRTVERLEQADLVEVVETSREGRRPERTTYRITGRGVDALADRVRALVANQADEFPEFAVALGLLHTLEPADARYQLETRVTNLESAIAGLDVWVRRLRERALPELYWLDLVLRRAAMAAERDWVSDQLDRLATGELAWPDEPTDNTERANLRVVPDAGDIEEGAG